LTGWPQLWTIIVFPLRYEINFEILRDVNSSLRSRDKTTRPKFPVVFFCKTFFCFCANLQVALHVISHMQPSQMNISHIISNTRNSQFISSTSYPKLSNCSSLLLSFPKFYITSSPSLSEGRGSCLGTLKHQHFLLRLCHYTSHVLHLICL
jgi:hypothetical protein